MTMRSAAATAALLLLAAAAAIGSMAAASASWGISGSGTAAVTATEWTRLTVPGNFQLTGQQCYGKSGNGTINASWNSVSGATGYRVEYAGNSTFTTPSYDSLTGTTQTGIPIANGIVYVKVQATPSGPFTAALNSSCPT